MTAEHIQAKITKLLRLAEQKDSAEEAAVAYAQAQRLATLHGLNLADVALSQAESEQSVPLVVNAIEQLELEQWRKGVAWKVKLCDALVNANKCKAFYSSARLVAYGQPADLHTVAVLYRSIGEQSERLAKAALRSYTGTSSGARTYGRAFRIGAVAEIRQRLPKPEDLVRERETLVNERRQLAVANDDTAALADATTALVHVCAAQQHLDQVKAALDTYAKDVLNLSGRGASFAGADSRGYYDGRNAAKAINISAPAKGLRG